MSRRLLVVIVACMLLWIGTRPGRAYTLVVIERESGRTLASYEVAARESFRIRYTHSVDRAPIWEVYEIDENGRIVLLETTYEVLGAGVEFRPEAGRYVQDGATTRITGMYRVHESVFLRTGAISDHRLYVGSAETRLRALAPGGSLLVITTAVPGPSLR